jgi:hypothetical protein
MGEAKRKNAEGASVLASASAFLGADWNAA